MAAYIIGLRRSAPRQMAWVKEYLLKTGALGTKHGGKAVIGGNSTQRLLALEGAEPPLCVVILEFPSLEPARAWHDGPDYGPLKQLRQANVDLEILADETGRHRDGAWPRHSRAGDVVSQTERGMTEVERAWTTYIPRGTSTISTPSSRRWPNNSSTMNGR